jgi:hypothetical protein
MSAQIGAPGQSPHEHPSEESSQAATGISTGSIGDPSSKDVLKFNAKGEPGSYSPASLPMNVNHSESYKNTQSDPHRISSSSWHWIDWLINPKALIHTAFMSSMATFWMSAMLPQL